MFVFLLEDEALGTRGNTEADLLAQTSEGDSPSLDEMNNRTGKGEILINVKYTIFHDFFSESQVGVDEDEIVAFDDPDTNDENDAIDSGDPDSVLVSREPLHDKGDDEEDKVRQAETNKYFCDK